MARLSCQEINIHGMRMSCHGEIFHITGPFCRESAWQAQEDFHHKGSIMWNFDATIGVFSRLLRTPDSKVHGANMGPIWGRQDSSGPHGGPMNFANCKECWQMFEHEILNDECLLTMSLSKLNNIMYWEIDTALCYGNNRTCIIIDKI